MAKRENSLKKMAVVMEKLAHKVEELERRLGELERESKRESVSKSYTTASFWGPLASVIAGIGLYNLLMDDAIEAKDVADALEVGMEDDEFEELLGDLEMDGFGEDQISLDDYLASEGDEGFDADFGDFDA